VTATILVTGSTIAADAEAMLRAHEISCTPVDPAIVDCEVERLFAECRVDGMIVRFGKIGTRIMYAFGSTRVSGEGASRRL
jgi:hypothetical protein